MTVEQRLLVAYALFCVFAVGFATCKVMDSRRVETIVAQYHEKLETLNMRLMELEK